MILNRISPDADGVELNNNTCSEVPATGCAAVSLKGKWFSLARKLEINRAVSFAVFANCWGLLAGPITALVIATQFTPKLQGYYYSFASLLTIQSFAELSLCVVIVQFTSHEWSRLSLNDRNEIVGDERALSRLVSLGGIVIRWYLPVSIALALGLGIGGYIFFSSTMDETVNWKYPWVCLSAVTALNVWLLPIISILEGCNQVSRVYLFRLVNAVCVSVGLWVTILLGARLWSMVFSNVLSVSCYTTLLLIYYRKFFRIIFFTRPAGPRIGWSSEMLPLQWRIALSRIGSYFRTALFTPILFHYHGPVVAGQMGLTWAVVSTVEKIVSSWLDPKAPTMGILIAKHEYSTLDRLFFRISSITFGLTCFFSAALWLIIFVLYNIKFPLVFRLLPPFTVGLFFIATIVVAISYPMSVYLRAHKEEPFVFVSVLSGMFATLLVFVLGKYFSANGVAFAYIGANIATVPIMAFVWHRFRRLRHAA